MEGGQVMLSKGEKIFLFFTFTVLTIAFALMLTGFPCNLEWAYCYKNP